ncbi:MAG TPA: hypothetical protein PLI01_00315 [Nitrospira sp.]|nr:hypothetical protein [Nitrospira sp.]HNA25202.1 hypothetical protein [Nitrospira sp.]HNI17492.1 hypothetical protein [Nitrospira sp.]
MHIWFKRSKENPDGFRGENTMTLKSFKHIVEEVQTGNISWFRINVKIGRYPFSFHIEKVDVERTLREAEKELNFRPKGEMASWPPSAA